MNFYGIANRCYLIRVFEDIVSICIFLYSLDFSYENIIFGFSDITKVNNVTVDVQLTLNPILILASIKTTYHFLPFIGMRFSRKLQTNHSVLSVFLILVTASFVTSCFTPCHTLKQFFHPFSQAV